MNPDVSFIPKESDRMMVLNAWNVLTLEDIQFLNEYEPPTSFGFMWDTNDRIVDIMTRIENTYPGHSATSLAITMRFLQLVIRNSL
ncbi:MAG: hypothetical protein EBT86_12160 [Actinobacteria bacterium]|nr:hypothetical protein [Actinomycetota bacterium]